MPAEHELLAPTLLRSQVAAALQEPCHGASSRRKFTLDAALRRRVEGLVATATIEVLREGVR